jgi:hypothetical protein
MNDQMALGGMMAILMAYIVFVVIISLAISIVMLVANWKINVKAGQPGWAILVPFYSLYIHLKVLQRPSYWIWLYIGSLLTAVILVGLIAIIVLSILDTIRLAKVFGKGDGFILGLIFLPVVFYPMLAFGDAQYQQLEN